VSTPRQASLLDGGTPAPTPGFVELRRHQLDATAWVDHHPTWVRGSDVLFEEVLAGAPWQSRERRMYGALVAEPRRTASWPLGAPEAPSFPVIDEMAELLCRRYDTAFDSVGLNLYRDGRDSVAWHGDRIARSVVDPRVAIVSLGHPRRFLLRPRAGGRSRAFHLGRGDLLVMGGSSQRTWLHSVPKVSAAGPRISVTFRHSA
jgi:alkylated DNA repair dioxygenase AlkB